MNTKNNGTHVSQYLSAYYDGELHGETRARVQAHLMECEACTAELESFASLSALLQEAPGIMPEASPQGTAVQVDRRIAYLTQDSWERKLLRNGWRYAPVFLIATWAFGRAVLWVSTFVSAFLPRNSVSYLESLFDINFQIGWATLLHRLLDGSIPTGLPSNILAYGAYSLFLTLFTAILMASWLASAWVYRRHKHIETRIE